MTAPKPFPHGYPEGYGMGPGPGRQFQTLFCQRCGAVVMSSPLHTKWHEELDHEEATQDDVKVSKRAEPDEPFPVGTRVTDTVTGNLIGSGVVESINQDSVGTVYTVKLDSAEYQALPARAIITSSRIRRADT